VSDGLSAGLRRGNGPVADGVAGLDVLFGDGGCGLQDVTLTSSCGGELIAECLSALDGCGKS
jgi:hypothetical protein